MVAAADMSHLNRLLDRVDELNNEPHLRDVRITLEEFKSFAELRKKLHPFSLALFSYGKINGLLTREDFLRAASHVCYLSLFLSLYYRLSLHSNEFFRILWECCFGAKKIF